MTRTIVTGATGFIGRHLVDHLSSLGHETTCLVRPSSDCGRLTQFQPQFVHGDITDRQSLRRAIGNADVVYHLAGVTKSLTARSLWRGNDEGVRNVAESCAELDRPPVLIVVSSLAAAGPSNGRPMTETDVPAPVSSYGRSKRAGELAALQFAPKVPITIVRPPIVLGEGDRDGFAMFESIAKWGIHLVPGMSDHEFSVIHAQDLARALVLLADRGRRVTADPGDTGGIYYASSDETPTYANLGRMIGKAVGRNKVMMVRIPMAAMWPVASISELVAQVTRRPHIVNLDKAREATAGSWSCSAAQLHRDTSFTPARPLQQRLVQTAQWYIEQGWLPKPRRVDRNVEAETRQVTK